MAGIRGNGEQGMRVALYEEGRFWDAPDIKRIFMSIASAKRAMPDGFETINNALNYDVYAENEHLERWVAIEEYEVEGIHMTWFIER